MPQANAGPQHPGRPQRTGSWDLTAATLEAAREGPCQGLPWRANKAAGAKNPGPDARDYIWRHA